MGKGAKKNKKGTQVQKGANQHQPLTAQMHVLYVETAEDQRRPGSKERCPGVHLGVQGLGPVLCDTCGSVADVWRARLDTILGAPLLKVALLGSLQHSYACLLDLMLLHERGQLMPMLLDRLAITPEQAKQWAEAEVELARVWLGCIGCVRRRPSRSTHLGSPLFSPHVPPSFVSGQVCSRTAAPPKFEALLERHRALIDHMAEHFQSAGDSARARAFSLAAESERPVTSAKAHHNRPLPLGSRNPTGVATISEAQPAHFKKLKGKRKHESWNTAEVSTKADVLHARSKKQRRKQGHQ